MTGRPDFIEGIYNYCDYMCEKCTNRDRCYLYWSEKHPKEAGLDFEKALEEMDEEFGDIEITEEEEWEKDPLEEAKEKEIEELCEKRMKPVKVLTNMTHSMVEKIDNNHWNSENTDLKDALENISENMFLVSAKLYRAIHGLPESVEEKPTLHFYGYDAENTLLALKGFFWNFKSGCMQLPKHMPEHGDTCKKLISMIDNLSQKVDEEYLPMVLELKKYDDV